MTNPSELVTDEVTPNCHIATSWLVCLSAGLFFFYELIQMNMFSAINNQVMEAFHISATQLGFLSGIYFGANVIFLFIAGIILDRYSTRKVITLSMLVCIAGIFLFVQSETFFVAALSRFLMGVGSAFCFLCCIRLATRWFPPSKMALATGCIVTMGMFGGMLAQMPASLLAQTLGWRQALLVDIALGLVILSIILLVVRDFPDDAVAQHEAQQKSLREIGMLTAMKLSLLRGHNWLAGVITSFINVTPIYLLGGVWGSFYLEQVHHMSPMAATSVTQMVFLGTIIGSPIVGYISDKVRLRREPMLIGTLLALVILMPIIFMNESADLTTMGALFFLLGIATSVQILGYPLVAENNPPALTATSVSVVSICTIGGGLVFQPFFGWIMDNHWQGLIEHGVPIYSEHAFREAMIIMPIGFIISFIAILLIKETNGKYQTD